MAKPLDFKDFITVDLTPGEPQEVKFAAKKRKRQSGGGGPVGEETELNTEALNTAQRLKRGRMMKRMHSRIEIGQKKAKRRVASLDVIKKRASKHARALIAKKLTKGINKSELTNQRKQEIEKRLDTPAMKARIQKLTKRLVPKLRKAEMDRKRGQPSSVKLPNT